MRLLDTREQKSPAYLLDNIPRLEEMQLDTYDYIDVDHDVGFGAELKHGDFDLKSTATLVQFEHELAKMARHHQEHPQIYPHAIWNRPHIWDRDQNFVWIEKYGEMRGQIAVFLSKCADYGVKGHVVESNDQTIKLLLRLKSWRPKAAYIRKAQTGGGILADMLAQFPLISPEMAISITEALSEAHVHSWKDWFEAEELKVVINNWVELRVYETVGYKKNEGGPKKLGLDFIHWLETGETP